jgi:hypothetical protein
MLLAGYYSCTNIQHSFFVYAHAGLFFFEVLVDRIYTTLHGTVVKLELCGLRFPWWYRSRLPS